MHVRNGLRADLVMAANYYQNSVLWTCCRALVNASAFSRDGSSSECDPIDGKCFLEKRFRWKLCLTAITFEWLSAIFLKLSTHSWRIRAFDARILSVSPDEQPTENVRESSSLGEITAPAKCSYQHEFTSLRAVVRKFDEQKSTDYLPPRSGADVAGHCVIVVGHRVVGRTARRRRSGTLA